MSGSNSKYVPFGTPGFAFPVFEEILTPFENSTTAIFPSRTEAARKYDERAFVAFMPTPFIPIACLKTLLLYFAPVFTLLTQSSSFPRGIPRPKSRILTLPSFISISILVPAP